MPAERFSKAFTADALLRQTIEYHGSEPAGTIIVDPVTKQLYFTEWPSRTTRYGVGVGREGFGWSGEAQAMLRLSPLTISWDHGFAAAPLPQGAGIRTYAAAASDSVPPSTGLWEASAMPQDLAVVRGG